MSSSLSAAEQWLHRLSSRQCTCSSAWNVASLLRSSLTTITLSSPAPLVELYLLHLHERLRIHSEHPSVEVEIDEEEIKGVDEGEKQREHSVVVHLFAALLSLSLSLYLSAPLPLHLRQTASELLQRCLSSNESTSIILMEAAVSLLSSCSDTLITHSSSFSRTPSPFTPSQAHFVPEGRRLVIEFVLNAIKGMKGITKGVNEQNQCGKSHPSRSPSPSPSSSPFPTDTSSSSIYSQHEFIQAFLSFSHCAWSDSWSNTRSLFASRLPDILLHSYRLTDSTFEFIVHRLDISQQPNELAGLWMSCTCILQHSQFLTDDELAHFCVQLHPFFLKHLIHEDLDVSDPCLSTFASWTHTSSLDSVRQMRCDIEKALQSCWQQPDETDVHAYLEALSMCIQRYEDNCSCFEDISKKENTQIDCLIHNGSSDLSYQELDGLCLRFLGHEASRVRQSCAALMALSLHSKQRGRFSKIVQSVLFSWNGAKGAIQEPHKVQHFIWSKCSRSVADPAGLSYFSFPQFFSPVVNFSEAVASSGIPTWQWKEGALMYFEAILLRLYDSALEGTMMNIPFDLVQQVAECTLPCALSSRWEVRRMAEQVARPCVLIMAFIDFNTCLELIKNTLQSSDSSDSTHYSLFSAYFVQILCSFATHARASGLPRSAQSEQAEQVELQEQKRMQMEQPVRELLGSQLAQAAVELCSLLHKALQYSTASEPVESASHEYICLLHIISSTCVQLMSLPAVIVESYKTVEPTVQLALKRFHQRSILTSAEKRRQSAADERLWLSSVDHCMEYLVEHCVPAHDIESSSLLLALLSSHMGGNSGVPYVSHAHVSKQVQELVQRLHNMANSRSDQSIPDDYINQMIQSCTKLMQLKEAAMIRGTLLQKVLMLTATLSTHAPLEQENDQSLAQLLSLVGQRQRQACTTPMAKEVVEQGDWDDEVEEDD